MDEVQSRDSATFTPEFINIKSPVGVRLDNVSASWAQGGSRALSNVSIEVGAGQLLGLIGPVGSGKVSGIFVLYGNCCAAVQ